MFGNASQQFVTISTFDIALAVVEWSLQMLVLGTDKLERFWRRNPNSKRWLEEWLRRIHNENWRTPHDVLDHHPRTSALPRNRVVFRIRGNRYRIVAAVNYRFNTISIRFVGTHAEYDTIDARRV